jgi:hypothetical protein
MTTFEGNEREVLYNAIGDRNAVITRLTAVNVQLRDFLERVVRADPSTLVVSFMQEDARALLEETK